MTATDPAPVEMKMSPEDFAELRARVAVIAQQDIHLGRVLDLLVLHLGHAHGLDPTVEDAKAKAAADEQARLEAEAAVAHAEPEAPLEGAPA